LINNNFVLLFITPSRMRWGFTK